MGHNHGKRWSGKDSRGTFRNGRNLVPGVVVQTFDDRTGGIFTLKALKDTKSVRASKTGLGIYQHSEGMCRLWEGFYVPSGEMLTATPDCLQGDGVGWRNPRTVVFQLDHHIFDIYKEIMRPFNN